MFVQTQTTAERFWSKVEKTVDCWIWKGALNMDGYGSFRLTSQPRPGVVVLAHSYLVGPAPAGLEWDHTCRQRACVRPDHLHAVTHKINIQRIPPYSRGNAEKTHCKFGHPFDSANTYITRTGARKCRACNREAAQRRYHAKSA